MSKMIWTVSGKIIIDKLAIIYSGRGKYENGESGLLDEQRAYSISEYWSSQVRIIMVKLKDKYMHVNLK